jgi:hypothetical protein
VPRPRRDSGIGLQLSGHNCFVMQSVRTEQKVEELERRTRELRATLARGAHPDEAFIAGYVGLTDHLVSVVRAASARSKGHFRAPMHAELGDAECGSSLTCLTRKSS